MTKIGGLFTDEELETLIDRWAQVSAVEFFNRASAWITLISHIEVVQAKDLAEHRYQLRLAHRHLGWAVFYADEQEIQQSRLLVWWARFQMMVAERKTGIQSTDEMEAPVK